MRVVITGGLGWLGKALTEVVSRHHTVRVFDLESVDVPREELDFDGEVRFGSITDFESVLSAVEGQDAIIHAAVASTVLRGLYEPGDHVPVDVNVRGTYNVLEAARQAGVGRVLQIAAAETHADHPPSVFVDRNTPYAGAGSIYDLTKRLQEETCSWFAQLHGLNVISLRLGDILDLERGMNKHGDEAWKQALAEESWIHRYDVGEACVRALEIDHMGHDIFHLVGAPSAKKRFDVARAEDVLGIELTTQFDPTPAGER